MHEIGLEISRGNWSAAESLCRGRLEVSPQDERVLFFLAYSLWRQSRVREALEVCQHVIREKPGDAALLNDLGNLARELNAPELALAALDRSLELRPGESGTLYNRALALDALDRPSEALATAGLIGPNDGSFAPACYLAGTIHQELGALELAEREFKKCLRASPGHPQAILALVRVRKYAADDPQIEALRQLASEEKHAAEARRHYLFALAKVLDDTEQYTEAFECLQQANELVDIRYPQQGIEDRLASLKAYFDTAPAWREPREDEATQVFVVGLPRSGTTLTEYLLEGHPEIYALGESAVLPALIAEPGRVPAEIEWTGLAEAYLNSLPPSAQDYRFTVDKMPGNFWRLGHIAAMFPGAKIIHCRRDPRDVAISNFFNLYDKGNSFAYSLADLAHYTACHDAIMAHWKPLLGERLLSMDYEKLTADPESEMRRAVEFLGLDNRPLQSRSRAPRRIRTASNQQVRKPVHTRSVGRWRHYPQAEARFSRVYLRQRRQLGLQ